MKILTVLLALLVATAALAQPAPTTTPAASADAAPFGLAALAKVSDPGGEKARGFLVKMITALGGKAYLSISTREEEGRSYSFYHGQPNSTGNIYWRFWKYPDKDRTEWTKKRDVIQIINGEKGFEITYKGTAPLEAQDLDAYLRNRRRSLEIVLREWLKDPRTVVLSLGPGIADRRMAELVSIINTSNEDLTLYIDPITWLPIESKYEWRDKDRYKNEEAILYGGYRAVEGIQTPFTITSLHEGEISRQRFLNSVHYNTAIEDSKYDASVNYDPMRPQKK